MRDGWTHTTEPERWLCGSCGANGEGRGRWDGTAKCPVCHKRRVQTNRCGHSGTPLCFVYGFGRHATVEDALRCDKLRTPRSAR